MPTGARKIPDSERQAVRQAALILIATHEPTRWGVSLSQRKILPIIAA